VCGAALVPAAIYAAEAAALAALNYARQNPDKVSQFGNAVVDALLPEGGPTLPGSYWSERCALKQVTPGMRRIEATKPSSRGGPPYRRVTHYDEYGRMTGQTHYGTRGEPGAHPNPHHHRYDPATGGELTNPETGKRRWPGVHPEEPEAGHGKRSG